MITVTLGAKLVANMCEVTKAFVRYAHLCAKKENFFSYRVDNGLGVVIK